MSQPAPNTRFTFDPTAPAPTRPTAYPNLRRAPQRSQPTPLNVHKITQNPSQMSQMSLVAKYMATDPDIKYAFEERAAIIEHDAGLPRAEAETRAFRSIMTEIRAVQQHPL